MIKCMYMISQCDSNYANEIFETYIIYHIMYIICRVCLRITCPARYVALKGVVCVSYEPRKKKNSDTFHCTACLIGVLIMVYYNLHIPE